MRFRSKIDTKIREYAKLKKKIYIIPTKAGFTFSAIMFAIFLIGLSYGNNLTLSVAFILFTYFVIEMLTTHKNLQNIEIQNLYINNNFANLPLKVKIYLKTDIDNGTYKLYINENIKINLNKSHKVLTGKTTLNRGHFFDKHVKISNTGNGQLFYVWRYYSRPVEFYVYPEKKNCNIKNIFNETENIKSIDEKEFHTHIPYNPSLSAKRINWKVLARTNQLYWKKYIGHKKEDIILDYSKFYEDKETRLSYLAFLVNKCFRNKYKWNLHLPNDKLLNCSSLEDYTSSLNLLAKVKYD